MLKESRSDRNEKRNLLYVDDQIENLVVFRAAFGKHFNIIEAQSADEALAILASDEVPVMVADQRMPNLTGVELCEIVRREYPLTIRMILTGYIDSDAMMEAINKGHVYNFTTKPWERDALFAILLRGFEAYDLATSNSALLERLSHTERCAALGRFAAGMAHEMRNQLFTLPLIEMVEQKYRNDQDLQKLAQIGRQTHDKLNELIDAVMDFVRMENDTTQMTPMNLAQIVREAVSLASLDKEIPKNVIALDVTAEPIVLCHKGKIEQVIFNLLKNAAHASSASDAPEIKVAIAIDGTEAVLSVQDNGTGIEKSQLDSIWEPFYSTKGKHGTGLGLDLCRKIVDEHQGAIACESALGHGARFTIRIPISKPSQDDQATARYLTVRAVPATQN